DQQVLDLQAAAIHFRTQGVADGVHGRCHTDSAGAADLYGTGEAADAGIVRSADVDPCIGVVQEHIVGIGPDLVVDDAAGIGDAGGNAAAAATGGCERADAGGAITVDANIIGT